MGLEPGLSLNLAPSLKSHSLQDPNTPLESVTAGSRWLWCYYYYYCLLLIMTVTPKTSLVQLGLALLAARVPSSPKVPDPGGPARRPRERPPPNTGSVWWRPLEAAVGIAARTRGPSAGSSAGAQHPSRHKPPDGGHSGQGGRRK